MGPPSSHRLRHSECKDEEPHPVDDKTEFADAERSGRGRAPLKSIRFEPDEKARSIASASDFVTRSTATERINLFSAKLGTTIPVTNLADLVLADGSIHNLLNGAPNGGTWWLDIVDPTEQEVDTLVNTFSIHPLTSHDVKMRDARERIELFKHYYYVCLNSFHRTDKGGDVRPFKVHIIVFEEGVLSFTLHNCQHTANVQIRMVRLQDYMNFTSDWVCYAIIDDIIDNFALLMTEIDQETNAIEDEVSVRGARDSGPLLAQIHICRHRVMSAMRLLSGKVDIIRSLVKSCGRSGSAAPRDDIRLYLGDIQDHVVTTISNLKHSDEILLRSRSSHLAQISVERIRTKHQIFQTISKCAIIAAILVLLNIICGLFGMNVRVPGGSSEGLGWWLGIAGLIAAGTLVSMILAKRRKLI
ncbi:hypothetical protein ABW19_dt0205432 [Dactylella cylindrospora]|nr:hypothetical protein ABW19_dt0205432 [Dactylella cylindrospora]